MGAGPALVMFDPTDASNLNDQLPRASVGSEVEFNGNVYMYVQFDNGAGNVASAVDRPAYWKDRDSYIVTSDKTDNECGAAIPAGCAGIFQGVVTDQYYTYIQRRGVRAKVRLSGAGAVGNRVRAPAADTDLILTTATHAVDGAAADGTTTAPLVGVQLAVADANNDAKCMLSIVN